MVEGKRKDEDERKKERKDEDEDIDLSWIENEEKMCKIDENGTREPMKEIAMFFVYVNTEFAIEQITKESEKVINNAVSKERLLQIIQTRRNPNKNQIKKYRLDDILSFQVDLGPDSIESFLRADLDDMQDIFLKSVPIFNEIDCLPSIFIFHDINSLYFIFREIQASGKSILKRSGSSSDGSSNGTSSSSNNNQTKKVRIVELLETANKVTTEYKRKSVKAKLSAFKKSMKQRG